MRYMPLLLISLALAGCGKPSGAISGEVASRPSLDVAIDLSTPDKAVKSSWAARDSINRYWASLPDQDPKDVEAVGAMMKLYIVDGVLRETDAVKEAPASFSRDIESVEVQSDSRAVVLARIRNTTPVPAGAEISTFDIDRRRDGDRYKYVLEKVGNSWKVAELWEWDTYVSKGWRKVLPSDTKPYVPTETSNGT